MNQFLHLETMEFYVKFKIPGIQSVPISGLQGVAISELQNVPIPGLQGVPISELQNVPITV